MYEVRVKIFAQQQKLRKNRSNGIDISEETQCKSIQKLARKFKRCSDIKKAGQVKQGSDISLIYVKIIAEIK